MALGCQPRRADDPQPLGVKVAELLVRCIVEAGAMVWLLGYLTHLLVDGLQALDVRHRQLGRRNGTLVEVGAQPHGSDARAIALQCAARKAANA